MWKDRRIIIAPVGLILIGTGMTSIWPNMFLPELLLTIQLSDKFRLVRRGPAWRQAVSRQLHHVCGWEFVCDFSNRHVSHIMPVTLFLTIKFAPATGMIWTSRKVRNIVKLDLNMVAGYITSLLWVVTRDLIMLQVTNRKFYPKDRLRRILQFFDFSVSSFPLGGWNPGILKHSKADFS